MSDTAGTDERDAINRLFELARDGETDNREFEQLESMVYDRFIHSYDHARAPSPGNTRIMVAGPAA